MNTSNTLKTWSEAINDQLLKQNFFNINPNDNHFLQIINDDYLKLFNELLGGKEFIVSKLKDVTHITKAMKEFMMQSENQNIIFSNLEYQKQDEILDRLMALNKQSIKNNSYQLTYLTFGTLEYSINNIKSVAPLIFIPVTITKKGDHLYVVKCVSNEVFVNNPLIDRIRKTRKIDLSYPVGNDFSLSEYIYYLSVKVKPINWIVNNNNYLSIFDFSYYYDLKMINSNLEKLNQNQLIKKISYLNSDFFSFNSKEYQSLDNKFLSLLDIDNEEYQLLKKVSLRENLLIRYCQNTNKFHLLSNIISSFTLNNKKVLVAYSDNDDKNLLMEEIKKDSLDRFCLDLDYQNLNKLDLLSYLASYDNFKLTFNSLHSIAIDEDVANYYEIKNNFLSLVNGLRTTKNPIETSINKLVNSYYALNDLEDIDITFKEVEKINIEILQYYIKIIDELSESINELNCPIKEHPFYGFNKKTMLRDDYLPLKNLSISLSTSLSDFKTIIEYGNEKFKLPLVNTLKEFKALLNILNFVKKYQSYPLIWVHENNIDQIFDELSDIYLKEKENNQNIEKTTLPYNPNIKSLTFDQMSSYLNKKHRIDYKKFKKDFQIKKTSKANIISLIENMLKFTSIKESLISQKNNYDASYINYLENHSLEEFRDIINEINIYRYNRDFINVNEDFEINNLIDSFGYNLEKHYQSMQYIFNSLLNDSKLIQEYFDEETFNYETIKLDDYSNKMVNMSSNFSSINQYLKFLTKLNRLNNTIPHLGDKLIKISDSEKYRNIYLKAFYKNVLNKYLDSKEFSQNLNRDNLFTILENFKDSDIKRKKIIERIITNNFNNNIRTEFSNIKTNEQIKIASLIKREPLFNNCEEILMNFKQSIYNFKPIILTSYKNISQLLKDEMYHFDVCIILSNRKMEFNQILPCVMKSNQLIIIDEVMITNDIRTSIIPNTNPNSLIDSIKNNVKELRYNRETHSVYQSMQKNLYDLDFKNYLASKLKSYGFQAGINRNVKDHVVDILVKVRNSNSSVAIMVDHLPYYSPEEASNIFYYQESFLKDSGYYPYRIFTSLYFLDEENEFRNLVDYIVTKSKLIPELAIRKKSIHLMDYLFPLYEDPRKTYYQLNNLESTKEKLKVFLNKTSPISLQEIRVIFKENIEDEIHQLVNHNYIEIKNNFIYVIGKKVIFRRIDRDEKFYRPLDLVSDKEIYSAIYEIIDYKNKIKKEDLIKMILLSLGYQKYNQAKYQYLEGKINYLLEKKIIFINEDYLLKNI